MTHVRSVYFHQQNQSGDSSSIPWEACSNQSVSALRGVAVCSLTGMARAEDEVSDPRDRKRRTKEGIGAS